MKAFHSSGPPFLPYCFVASVASFALTSGNNKCHRIRKKSRERIGQKYWIICPAAWSIPHIECVLPGAVLGELSFCRQLSQVAFHGGGAEGWAELQDLSLGELAEAGPDRILDRVQGRGADDHHPLVKVTVCGNDRTQQVFDESGGVVFLLMPANLRGFQRVIIGLFVPRNLGLQRNIFSDLISRPIEQQRGEEPGHPAVAVRQYHIETPQGNDS